MARVLVNNEATSVETGLKTWGELLSWADRTSAGRGQLVTAVRLDGVDEPSFRDESLAGRALESLATIEFDATSPGDLVSESLEEGRAGLNGLRDHALEVARRFRGTRVGYANQGLAEFTQGLATLVSLVEAIGEALGMPIDTLSVDDTPVVALIDAMGEPLQALGQAQAQEDWVTVADILEFDLEPALARCEPFFDAVATLSRQTQPTH